MQSHSYLQQAALVAGLCVLANPVFAEKPRQESPALERTGSTAPAQAETAADQALAERIRQGLQENAPLSGVAHTISSSPTARLCCSARSRRRKSETGWSPKFARSRACRRCRTACTWPAVT